MYVNPIEESFHFEQRAIASSNLGELVDIVISMQETKTDDNARDLTIHQRKCFFEDEMLLKYFKDEPYTFSGCLKECKLERALQICGCLPPFYRPALLSNVTFCDVQVLKCLKDERIWDVTHCAHCELSCDFKTFSIEKLKKG